MIPAALNCVFHRNDLVPWKMAKMVCVSGFEMKFLDLRGIAIVLKAEAT